MNRCDIFLNKYEMPNVADINRLIEQFNNQLADILEALAYIGVRKRCGK